MADLNEPGWSSEAARSGPKQAALLAMAAEPVPPVPFVTLESSGVVLICGRDEIAVEAGNLLKDHLDVTVLIEPPAAIAPPRITDFPVAKGKGQKRQRSSRRIRSHRRRFRAGDAVLARRIDVRALARQCTVELRYHP